MAKKVTSFYLEEDIITGLKKECLKQSLLDPSRKRFTSSELVEALIHIHLLDQVKTWEHLEKQKNGL